MKIKRISQSNFKKKRVIKMNPDLKQIAEDLVLNLNECDIECYLYHVSNSGNSFYIRFKDARIGSIRISDHEGRDRYRYKYNLRSDMVSTGRWQKIDGSWCFYMSADYWAKMIDILIERVDFLSKYNSVSSYGNKPKHKKNG